MVFRFAAAKAAAGRRVRRLAGERPRVPSWHRRSPAAIGSQSPHERDSVAPMPSLRLQLTGAISPAISVWAMDRPSPASSVGNRQTSTTWADDVAGDRTAGRTGSDRRKRVTAARPERIHLPATESANRQHGRRGDPSAHEDHDVIGCLHTIPRDRLVAIRGNTTKIGQTTQDQRRLFKDYLVPTRNDESLTAEREEHVIRSPVPPAPRPRSPRGGSAGPGPPAAIPERRPGPLPHR